MNSKLDTMEAALKDGALDDPLLDTLGFLAAGNVVILSNTMLHTKDVNKI